MSQKTVAVILCTYNGEKYIREQVDSILAQSWTRLHLYIQDDCSTDGTMEALRFCQDDPRVTACRSGRNLGYPGSFYDLLSRTDGEDYYAFSDQDDVWEKGKLERAVNLLEQADESRPAVAFANYEVCDENLNTLRISAGPNRKPDFLYSLYACLGLGFAMVINRAARKLITERQSVKTSTKDVWIGMCCTAFGEAFFDPVPCAKHRRNAGAFSSQDRNFLQIQRDRIRKFVFGDEFSYVYAVMQEFEEMFREELPEEREKELLFFLNRGFPHRFRKVFYPRRLRYAFSDEIMLRMVFLTGKL
ncbi:MAG: glycosyltransferase [Clostridium sp.]|nr:glycosyltransferase [Clostridium sp.]